MWMLFFNLLPGTISPVDLLRLPPRRKILSDGGMVTAAWLYLCWLKRVLKWQDDRILLFTSTLQSGSILLLQSARRCNQSECHPHRTRRAAFQRQRGCGRFSLGRRIRGWEGWEVTWFRKRRDGCRAVGIGWENLDTCFSSRSSADDKCWRMKA